MVSPSVSSAIQHLADLSPSSEQQSLGVEDSQIGETESQTSGGLSAFLCLPYLRWRRRSSGKLFVGESLASHAFDDSGKPFPIAILAGYKSASQVYCCLD